MPQITKEEAKVNIEQLVGKYERIVREGKIHTYNEAQTRNEFIEPLFEYLGWDMRNRTTDNEVTTEENVSGGRVDLAFRLGNIPAMFLEAKAMKVDLDEWRWAEQAINYSWNKSVTWAVLTDFECIKVFNAELPPKGIIQNLFIELQCRDFVKRFDQLWLLSKESFEKKLLDSEAEKWGKITARKPVGEKLFEDLMSWRIALTQEFKKQNQLTEEELDEGVQRILDRLIFIRTAEDRKIEPNTLQELYRASKPGLYRQLVQLFRDFDAGYNSKLFAPHYCETWLADDAILVDVLSGLYETKDGYRYDFSVISADVLGGMYEQYLGFVQSKSKDFDGEKRTKRKSQGIYYTPKYIVEFIVNETLGEVLKKTKPKDMFKIRVLDPACGSGSFLTAAYDEILKNIDQPSLFDEFFVLKENIFGVDLDVQAVEIAQLNLLLKVLSQKTQLPTLQHNLRVGNSLLSEGDASLKPFNFKTEFKKVFDQGGFDVIIGNPPYIKEYTNKSAFDGLHDNPYYQGKMDIWTLFACHAIDMLNDGGYFSFIAPASWIASSGASVFREKLFREGEIIKFIDFSDFRVFKEASIQTMIFVFQKKKPRNSYKARYAKIMDKKISGDAVAKLLSSGLSQSVEGSITADVMIEASKIGSGPISFSNEAVARMLSRIESAGKFRLSIKEVAQGIIMPQEYVIASHMPKLKDDTVHVGNGIFVVDEGFAQEQKLNSKEVGFLKPYYTSEQINRYLSTKETDHRIIYADKSFREHISEFPNLKAHLDRFAPILTSDFAPYGLHRSREEKFFKGPSIFSLRKASRPSFTYVNFSCYVSQSYFIIQTPRINLKYLTALLNSAVVNYWLKNKGKKQGEQLQIDKEPLLAIPLLKPSDADQVRIAGLVETLMVCNAELNRTSENTDKWHQLKVRLKELEDQINKKVYDLYDLTEDEIVTLSQS